MDNLSGKDFLKTLKCLDVDTGSLTGESLDWLFDKKDTSDISTWICTYLNENNIETCNEIQEYNTLKNEGYSVTDEYINNACKSNPLIDNILNIDASQLNTLRRDIENAKIRSHNLNKLTSKYLFLEGKLNKNIETEEMNLRIKRKAHLTECVEAGKQIDELHKDFWLRVEKFSNILTNYNMMKEKYFISQMPLHNYEQQCDLFQTNLQLWIRKIFEISKFSYSEEDVESVDKELNRLYFMVRESLIKLIQSECNQKELTAKLNFFRTNTTSEMSEEYIRIQSIQCASRINILYKDIESLYENDLQQTAEKFSENLVNTVLIKNAENKLNKYKDTLKTLKLIKNEVLHALAQYELLFLLLKTDKSRLRDIDKFLEDLYFYSSDYLKKYSLKSQIMSEIEENTVEQDFKEIISLLTEKYNSEPINIRIAISEVEKQKVAVENLENDLFVIKNQKYMQETAQIKCSLDKIKNVVWCGPTLQPVITPYEYLENLHVTNSQLEKVKKALKTTMDNLNQTRVCIKKDTWATHKRLLWVWFLMKPEKIPTVIEQLKDYVTEKARNET